MHAVNRKIENEETEKREKGDQDKVRHRPWREKTPDWEIRRTGTLSSPETTSSEDGDWFGRQREGYKEEREKLKKKVKREKREMQ